MAGPPSPPLLLSTMSAAGTLFNTYTTAKRVMVADDVINIPGNFLKSRAHIRWEVRGGLSNVATTPGNVFFQVMMGASRIVAMRSRTLGMVRVAMIPGIAQAYEDSSGMKDRPDNPTLPMSRSSRKAARGR